MDDYDKKDNDKKKKYLNREDEIEAFQYQLKYDKENRGDEEAEKYVDHLLDFHKTPEDQKEDKNINRIYLQNHLPKPKKQVKNFPNILKKI